MLKCKRCGCKITGKHWNSKYCTDCAYIRSLERARYYSAKKYRKLKELGTTYFHEHRCHTFEKEQREINQEFYKLGLKKDKLYKK